MTTQVMTTEEIRNSRQSNVRTSVGMTDSDSFALAQRAGTLLAASGLVPKEYQNNIPNCVVALNMASRIGADPLMVMQNLVIVHQKPTWSSQFLIATFNACGKFSALRYEFFGEKGTDSWGCRAWAVEHATGQRIEGSDITIALAKKEGWFGKSGSKWQSMPQQMLMYRAASWLVRAYAPELAMGLHTADEMIDAGAEFDVTPKTVDDVRAMTSKTDESPIPVIDGSASSVYSPPPAPQATAPTPAPTSRRKAAEPVPVPQQTPLIERLRNAPTQDELDQLSTEIEFLDGQKQQDAAWEAYRIRNTELNA